MIGQPEECAPSSGADELGPWLGSRRLAHALEEILIGKGLVYLSAVFKHHVDEVEVFLREFDDGDSGWHFSIAGEIGLFGSLSGRCYLQSEDDGGFRQGVFIATFTPAGIADAQKAAVIQQLGDIMGSDQKSYLLFSDVLIDDSLKPQISYGTIILTQNGSIGFNYSDLTVNRIIYSGADADNDPVWDGSAGNLNYIGADEQMRILATRRDNTYFIIPAGCRKGICVTVDGGGNIAKAGQMFLNRSDSLAPVLEPGTSYTLAQAFIGSSVLAGVTREEALETVVPELLRDDEPDNDPRINVPSAEGMAFGSGYNTDSGEIFAVSGGFLALKKDADDDFADTPDEDNDYIMSLEMYETGALTGVHLNAGSWLIPGYGLFKNYESPISNVMFACKQGAAAPAFKGTMKFLAREFQGGGVFPEVPVWTSGKLTVSIDSASSTGQGSLYVENIDGCGYDPDDPIEADGFTEAEQNYPSTVSMQVERIGPSNSGLLHIYGTGTYTLYFESETQEDMDYYWDIFWPIGAPKGIYMFSYRDGDGEFRINEIGEASITY